MSNETNAAEPSGASAGSHGDAALWALEWREDAGRIDPEWVYATREEATEVNETGCHGRAAVVPLYRQPTLTSEEWASVKNFLTVGRLYSHEAVAGVLRKLLGESK